MSSKPHSKMAFQPKTLSEVHNRQFPSENFQKAINLLIYGVIIKKTMKSSSKLFHPCIFYILEDDPDFLQWISHKKLYNKTRIDLRTIKNITDDPKFDSKLLQKFRKCKEVSHLLFISFRDLTQEKLLTLKFKDIGTKFLFWQGLQYLVGKACERACFFGDTRKAIARRLFLKADKDGSKSLDMEEIKKILQQLHIEMNQGFLSRFFEKYDKDKNRLIDWPEFQALIDDISLKPELKDIFSHYSRQAQFVVSGNLDEASASMSFDDFRCFLRKEQKQDITEEDFCELLYLMHKDEATSHVLDRMVFSQSYHAEKKRLAISFSEFCSLIFSKNNEIFDPDKLEVHQDMTRPLSEYYISSSHNTYLLANQLTGESSTKAYVNAFAKGCRCVELDCWDGDKGEPIIYHGYTLTTKILFRDVIQTIKDYAFQTNPYPVILSLENHCKEKQQVRLAEIMEETLGEALYRLPDRYEEFARFPSPNDLKGKILVKDKARLPMSPSGRGRDAEKRETVWRDDETRYACDDDESYILQKSENFSNMASASEWCLREKCFINGKNDPSEVKQSTLRDESDDHCKDPFECQIANLKSEAQADEKKRASMLTNSFKSESSPAHSNDQQLADPEKMPQRLRGKLSFFGIKLDLSLSRSIWNISSLKEPRFDKLCRERPENLQDFLRRHFIRVYPSGTRIDSSNFDPVKCFNFGAQMIALNIQKPDYALMLYLSKFMENGGRNCGYVRKPEFLLEEKPRYLHEFKKIAKILHITVISAQQLRPEDENDVRDVVDPYVEVWLRGTPCDEKENAKIFRSSVVLNNGFNPRFDLECQFKLSCPEMTFIVFRVLDREIATKDMKIGWNSVPFNCLRTGYRVVPLLNSSLEPIDFSYLLVKAEVNEVYSEL